MPASKCPDIPECSSALKPDGHCCYDVCGAIIHVQKPWNRMDIPFNMEEAKEDLNSLIKPENGPFGQKSKHQILIFFIE